MDNAEVEKATAGAEAEQPDLLSMDSAGDDGEGEDADEDDGGEDGNADGGTGEGTKERRRQAKKQRRDEATAVARLDALRKLQQEAAAARQRYETARFDLVWLLNQVECRKWHRLVRSIRAMLQAQREFASRVFESASALPRVLQKLDWQLDTTAKAFATEMRLWRAQRIALVGQLQSSTDSFSTHTQLAEQQPTSPTAMQTAGDAEAVAVAQSGEGDKQQLESVEEKQEGKQEGGGQPQESTAPAAAVAETESGTDAVGPAVSAASAAALHPLEAVSTAGVYVLSTKTVCRELYLHQKKEEASEAGEDAKEDAEDKASAASEVGAERVSLETVSMSSMGALCHTLRPEVEPPPPAVAEAAPSPAPAPAAEGEAAQAAAEALAPQPQLIRSVTRQDSRQGEGGEEKSEGERMQEAMLAHNQRVMMAKQRAQREKEQEQRVVKRFDASLEVLVTKGHSIGVPILQGFLWEKQESLMTQMSIAGNYHCIHMHPNIHARLHLRILLRWQQVAKSLVQPA
jgi:hypothetical protein